MKNLIRSKPKLGVSALLTLLLCLCLGGAYALSPGDYGVVYGTTSLNLRSQGSSSSQWLGAYPSGTWMQIIGSQNNFYQVLTPDGKTGYMSKNYIDLAFGESDFVWTVLVTNQNGGAFLNFRTQPSYSSRVLGIFYDGVPLNALALSADGWYQVRINGQVGYVRQEYVTDWGRRNAGSSTVATIKTPNNSAMNLRSGPGTQHGVIAQFPGDRYVSVLTKGKGWWCVSIDGYVGFMDSRYLSEGLQTARDVAARQGGGSTGLASAVVSNPKSTQALNLRQYASTASTVLDSLYNGTTLWVNEQGTEWCSVTDPSTGLTGYVMTRYITLHNLPSVPTRTVVHPSGTYVNLRSSANMGQNNVLARVPRNSKVTVLIPGPDWCKVRYGNHTGYMLTYFLQ